MKILLFLLLQISPINVKVDYYTNEELVGVKVNYEYSDFNGEVKLKSGKLNISYPSYEVVDTVLYKDSVIKLKQY